MRRRSLSFFTLTPARVWSALILIILVGAFLRVVQLGSPSLWDGEIFTLWFARYDWRIFLQSISAFSAHPPLWFALTKLAIAGDWNEFILRLPAVFAGILSLPALFVLGKRFFDLRVGLMGALLLACSPLDVIFSQNARNYSLFVLLTVLLIYGAVRAVQDGHARWWILFVAAALAGLYTHYLFLLPLGGTILAVTAKYVYAAVLQVRRDAPRARTLGETARSAWAIALKGARGFLIALIAIGALYLPWTPTVGSAFLGRQLTREATNEAGNDDEDASLTFQDAPRLLKDFSGSATWGLVLFSALAVIGIASAWRAQKRDALFWFGTAILLPLVVMLLLAPRRLPAKYLIYVLPAYLMFVAQGVTAVAEFAQRAFLKSNKRPFSLERPFALALAAVLLAVLLIASVPNMPYWNGRQTIFTGKGWSVVDEWRHWRQAAAYISARAAPGDFVLFPPEARALTARSVLPYFTTPFLENLYSAPPTGRAWWISESQDVPTTNAPFVRSQEKFENVVVQELQHTPAFAQVALPNASFEDNLQNWTLPNNQIEWALDRTNVMDGSASLQVTVRRPNYVALRSTEFPVTPGKLYRVSAYIRNYTVGFYTVSPQLFVNFYAATNTPPKRTRLPILVPTQKQDWTLIVTEGIVPDDTKTARVEFGYRDYARAFDETSWVDGIEVWVEK